VKQSLGNLYKPYVVRDHMSTKEFFGAKIEGHSHKRIGNSLYIMFMKFMKSNVKIGSSYRSLNNQFWKEYNRGICKSFLHRIRSLSEIELLSLQKEDRIDFFFFNDGKNIIHLTYEIYTTSMLFLIYIYYKYREKEYTDHNVRISEKLIRTKFDLNNKERKKNFIKDDRSFVIDENEFIIGLKVKKFFKKYAYEIKEGPKLPKSDVKKVEKISVDIESKMIQAKKE
jgi:hypothetical protein